MAQALVGLLCVLSSAPALGDAYLDELIARSRQLGLSERLEWHRLVHYERDVMPPGVHSLADAPGFFLAADGKTNPQGELEATLASFFSTIPETDKQQNPQCAFIARYNWLDQQLGFDAARLVPQPCARFSAWRSSLDPKGMTLVFPAAYLNNPSSMFGHTLLRIDASDQDESTRLLAYAINYAADTAETNGVAFAVNGLIGGYPGMFSIMPYYLKVREYSDMENRDIWEYELNLTPEEIDRVLMHAWELGPVYFDYYFFDENCSYYLLELLDTARPDLDLTRDFRWWAIPSDTVRAVVREPGLVRKTVFRPSNATVIRQRLGRMSPDERALVMEISHGQPRGAAYAGLTAEQQARVMEVSYDYLSYLRAVGKSPVGDPDGIAQSMLQERSRIGAVTGDPPASPPATRPDEGHGTARLQVGGGRRDGLDFIELRARPAYHDLLDPGGGYVDGAEIEFMDFALRDYSGGVGLRLEELTPVRIVSISPRNEFFQPLSWKIDAGWARRRVESGAEPLVVGVHGGAGFARAVPDRLNGDSMIYAFLEGTIQADHELDDGYALGIGPSVGALIHLGDNWRAEVFAREQSFIAGDNDTAWALGLRQSYTLARDWALRLDLSREGQEGQSWGTLLLSVDCYF